MDLIIFEGAALSPRETTSQGWDRADSVTAPPQPPPRTSHDSRDQPCYPVNNSSRHNFFIVHSHRHDTTASASAQSKTEDHHTAAGEMMRSNPASAMQKTYDECFLVCSTAIYFESKVCLPAAHLDIAPRELISGK
jgi:hypothetical protein